MRDIIGTGILAFAALALGVERDADACNTIPPENDCAVTRDGDILYYARNLTTVQTNASPTQNCGCGQALGNLPEDSTVVSAGVFTLAGQPTDGFCGGGINPQTTQAFQTGLGGIGWSPAVLNAVSTGGVTGGVPVYGIWKVSSPTGELTGYAAVAQVNFTDGQVSLDPQHQAVAPIDVSKCTDCTMNPSARACIATATARPQLDFTAFAAHRACAKTDAVPLLGLEGEGATDDSGCNAGRGPASALGFALVGFAVVLRRRRRRA